MGTFLMAGESLGFQSLPHNLRRFNIPDQRIIFADEPDPYACGCLKKFYDLTLNHLIAM